jgi:hypothetical protein
MLQIRIEIMRTARVSHREGWEGVRESSVGTAAQARSGEAFRDPVVGLIRPCRRTSEQAAIGRLGPARSTVQPSATKGS